jgi:hypothetical protein
MLLHGLLLGTAATLPSVFACFGGPVLAYHVGGQLRDGGAERPVYLRMACATARQPAHLELVVPGIDGADDRFDYDSFAGADRPASQL